MYMCNTTQERRFFSWLAGGVVVALLVVTGLVGYALHQGRAQYIATAQESSNTLAVLLQSNLHASIRDIDLTLRRAQVEFRNLHEQQRFSDAAFSAYLRSLKERIPDAASIRATNALGQVIYGEGIDLQNVVQLQANATGTDMFEHARNTNELVFGLPVKSRISGQWVLPVARALHLPDETFSGIAYANINMDRIADSFAALSAGTHGEITLFDHEKRILCQSPATADPSTMSTYALDPGFAGALFSGQPVAAYLTTDSASAREHIVKPIAIAPYPIYAAVSLDVDEVLANWRLRARTTALSVVIFYGLAGLMLLAVRRAMSRQQLAQDQALRQSELLDEVINQLPFGVAAYDAQRCMRLRNRKYGELLKYPAELLLREPLHFADVVHFAYARGDYGFEQPVEVVLAQFVKIMETRQSNRLERRQADGTFIEFRTMPIASDWTLIAYTDISDHKASEQTLLLARQAADAANQVKSNFLAAMSHEIRTPMNGVLGLLKLLQHTELSTRQLDYTKKAEGATLALLGIINDILDFSKVEAGKLELHDEPVVLGELMRDLSVILSSNVAHKDIEVLFAVEPEVPPVLKCDGLRLRQILLNLASNAVKFTEHGEVVLSIRVVQRQALNVQLEFSVQDTGIGIPADKLNRIFDAFSQAESSTTRRFGGSGLGLAISKQLVNMMGGNLLVESVLGQGSRFSFCATFGVVTNIPDVRSQLTGTIETQAPGLQLPGGPGLRVLIVDDNALARTVLQDMSVAMGWQAEALASGSSALRRLALADGPGFDLVLIDWRMPELDGWETTRLIRQLQHGGNAPVVIMVTAAGREMLAEKGKDETNMLDGYLVKPITASMLYEAVADAIVERRGERRLHLGQFAGQALRGLRLLLVEDNVLNQQIAQELLQGNGALVEIASCGLDGVAQALAARPPFDAILMDMQMPDIDGLEATRRIRSRLEMLTIPIIAMTANAMAADKQACLDAGMVDHIAKPFDLEHLIATIVRHTSPTHTDLTNMATGQTSTANVATGEVMIDSRTAIARIGGSHQFYAKLLVSFRAEAAQQLSELQAHVAQADVQRAAQNAHTLKGLAATVGATDLSTHAADFETALHAWKLDTHSGAAAVQTPLILESHLQSLSHIFAKTLAALDSLDRPVAH